jgi:hypothetical protein
MGGADVIRQALRADLAEELTVRSRRWCWAAANACSTGSPNR